MKVERVVVDSNVLISALLTSTSSPAALLERVLRNHRLMFSQATFQELQARLWRPKFDRYVSMENRSAFLNDLAAVAEWVEPKGDLTTPACRDPDDEKFLQLALASQAAWLVTGDQDLLVLKCVGAARIVNPAAALLELAEL